MLRFPPHGRPASQPPADRRSRRARVAALPDFALEAPSLVGLDDIAARLSSLVRETPLPQLPPLMLSSLPPLVLPPLGLVLRDNDIVAALNSLPPAAGVTLAVLSALLLNKLLLPTISRALSLLREKS